MEKKSSAGVIVLIVVLLLVSLGLGGFIIYDKVLNKEENHINENINKNEDSNLHIIKKEINNFIAALNSDNLSLENKCFYLSTDFIDIEDNDLLTQIAPYLMYCLYDISYEEVNISPLYTTYVMNKENYNAFKTYFNVNLKKVEYNDEEYYKAFDLGDGFGENKYTYFIKDDIIKNNDEYKVIINIQDKDDKDKNINASLTISLRNNHVFYDKFIIE